MNWLLAALLTPFLTAAFCLACSGNRTLVRAAAVAGAAALLPVSLLLLRDVLADGFVVVQPGNWPAPFGITLVADLFSATMIAVSAVVATAVAVYSLRDIDDRTVDARFYPLFHLLLLGVNGAFLTGDLFNLYVWFEVMLIASFVLITMGGRREQLEGGVKYLVINLLASLLFLAGAGLIYGKLGTLNMADIAVRLADSPDSLLINSSSMLLLAAFGIKSALFPFFFWLPASYHTPAISVSALFAGLLTKVGVYALIRSYTLLFESQFDVVQGLLVLLAAATMVTGVLGAAAQFNIRRILSFHIVSQIGYMLMGLAIGSSLAIAGALFYMVHHIVVKTNLFLIGGLVAQRTGGEGLKSAGGLYRSAPALALLFLVPALSLGGIPPLSGFWAKLSIVQAGLLEGHYLLVAAALAVGLLTLYSMTKIWNEAFWKESPQPLPVRALPASGVLPCVALAAITLALGIWSAPLFALADAAGQQLLNPSLYIEAVLGGAPE